MLNLVLFGPPGAGKGTQAEYLASRYNLIHISTGDLFRANIKGGTPLGVEAKSFIDKGQLVPDSVTIGMLSEKVEEHLETNGFVFDGFPRTPAQAEALGVLLAEKNTSVTLMLALEVEEGELVKRLLLRGQDSGRADDQDENIISNRIAVYEQETAILKDYYASKNKFVGINGIGSIASITELLSTAINVVV